MHQNAQHVLTMFVQVVIVRVMTTLKHENFVLDLTEGSKGKLYKDNILVFMGDGYRAITILVKNCKDPKPVQEKFKAQLTMREACRFTVKEKDK